MKRYESLAYEDTETFVKDLDNLNKSLSNFNFNKDPVMIFMNGGRNFLQYYMMVYYSILEDQILDYASITGHDLINQHFLESQERDNELMEQVYRFNVDFIHL
jgi:hypothetical protein